MIANEGVGAAEPGQVEWIKITGVNLDAQKGILVVIGGFRSRLRRHEVTLWWLESKRTEMALADSPFNRYGSDSAIAISTLGQRCSQRTCVSSPDTGGASSPFLTGET